METTLVILASPYLLSKGQSYVIIILSYLKNWRVLKVDTWKIILIISLVVIGVLIGLYFWGKRLQTKYDEQQALIDQNKQVVQIFILDKKKDKLANAKLPKQVKEQFPKMYKRRKMPLVIAKIGPQITTLLCDEKIYKILPTKKQVKVELAGLFIVGVKGPKSNQVSNKTKKQSWVQKKKNKINKKV